MKLFEEKLNDFYADTSFVLKRIYIAIVLTSN